VAGDDHEIWADEYGICPAEFSDAGGDLRDLLVSVRPRISYTRDELVDWNQTNLQIPHTPERVMNHAASFEPGPRIAGDSQN
jgi:hypothetical protein